MPPVTSTCPNCGASLDIPDDSTSFTCSYCAQKITIERAEPTATPALVIGPDIANLASLARTAEESQNYAEAYKYWSKILERDPQNVRAWVGKGIGAGFQSTLARPRLAETLVCLRKAISLKIPSKSLLHNAAAGGHAVALAFFKAALEPYSETKLHGTRYTTDFILQTNNEFAVHAYESLLLAEFVWQEMEKSTDLAQHILGMCKGLHSATGMFNTSQVPSEAIAHYKVLKAEVAAWGKAHDPQWEKKTGGCFVATATMGNYNHPTVVLLRTFRNQCLLQSPSGRRFVTFYYNHGPKLAAVIQRSRFFRHVSYVGIVLPMACVARIALRKSASRTPAAGCANKPPDDAA